MRLYLIKRKLDGMFFVNINGAYSIHTGKNEEQWSDKGRFFRTPDGVAGNLRKLCSTPFWCTDRPAGLSPNITRWREVGWRDFDEAKLAGYDVVMMDVDILSMTATPATDFIQIEAIADIPLNRSERRAAS